jgi:hypothetical protein
MAEEKLISLGDDEEGIEIDIESGDEKSVRVKVEKDDDVEVVETKTESKESSKSSEDDDDLANYSEGVKKRIEKLTFKYREAERREQAALDFARGLKTELDSAKQRSHQLDTSLLNEANTRLKTQEQLINDRLRTAIDRGDTETQITAQRELANLAVQNDRLQRAQVQRQYEAQQIAQAPQPAPPPPRPDAKAQTWAERNEWFGNDEPMTLTAFSIHKNLVEKEGFDPSADDYYSELDKRIRKEFPHKFQSEQKGKPTSMVASANPSPRSENRKQVKLTPSQVAIAKRLGVSLKEYARQVQRLNG